MPNTINRMRDEKKNIHQHSTLRNEHMQIFKSTHALESCVLTECMQRRKCSRTHSVKEHI